jgi:hypothetical protein
VAHAHSGPAGERKERPGTVTSRDFPKPTAGNTAVGFFFIVESRHGTTEQVTMNTDTITSPAREAPGPAELAEPVGLIRLWVLYQFLGLEPEPALAAARADFECGIADPAPTTFVL